jgi:hypothetical protein
MADSRILTDEVRQVWVHGRLTFTATELVSRFQDRTSLSTLPMVIGVLLQYRLFPMDRSTSSHMGTGQGEQKSPSFIISSRKLSPKRSLKRLYHETLTELSPRNRAGTTGPPSSRYS